MQCVRNTVGSMLHVQVCVSFLLFLPASIFRFSLLAKNFVFYILKEHYSYLRRHG